MPSTGSNPPPIYLFHGEDEFGIAIEVAKIKARLGEGHAVDMNFMVLEPGTYSLGDLRGVALTVGFFDVRRVVVAKSPLSQFSKGKEKKGFQALLETLPDKTALVITEPYSLKRSHWLIKWSEDNPGKVFEKNFPVQAGSGMSAWIQQRTQAQGGEISREAANELADLVGTQKRHAAQEVDKLLAFSAYSRQVEIEDVRLLSTGVDEEAISDVFNMVDTLAQRKPKKTMVALHHLLQVYDAGYLYFMVVRQFRLLILARESFDLGLRADDLAQQVKIKPWLATKLINQARNFDLAALEEIYHQLLELDQAVKTGQSDYLLALDILVAGLTPRPASHQLQSKNS
jgi:DNA polymerase-3 subunit delta